MRCLERILVIDYLNIHRQIFIMGDDVRSDFRGWNQEDGKYASYDLSGNAAVLRALCRSYGITLPELETVGGVPDLNQIFQRFILNPICICGPTTRSSCFRGPSIVSSVYTIYKVFTI